MKRNSVRLFLAAGSVMSAGVALGAPTLTILGDLPGGQFWSDAYGVSADGRVVVGTSIVIGHILLNDATFAAFRWDAHSGIQQIHAVPGFRSACIAYGANHDGSVVVGSADRRESPANVRAFLWTPQGGATEFGDLDGGAVNGVARAVSPDGAVIVGAGQSDLGPEAFRFTRSDSTFAGLGDLPGNPFRSDAYAISADGSTIVGMSFVGDRAARHAFRWTQADGMVSLGDLSPPEQTVPVSEAFGVNADGSVIVGVSRDPVNGEVAFRWTPEGGMVSIGDIPGGPAPMAIALATNADGSVVVGRGSIDNCDTPFGCVNEYRAFIWDAQNGIRDLNTVLAAMGTDMQGMKLLECRGISADGRVIVGNGIDAANNRQAWRVEFEHPGCPADFNGDNQVDFFDYLDFVLAFDAEGPSADFNGDHQIDFFDYLDFASAFSSCS
jgi:probable HAF family extracellular repeat protein